jgi:hypothetical protein
MRDGDLSEKAPPSWRLVGEASYGLETRRLASDGLDEDLELFLVLNFGLYIVNSVRRLHLKSDYLAIKGGPILGPRQ